MAYQAGDSAKLSTVITRDGVAIDPSTVSLKVEDPTGVETTYTYPTQISKTAVGHYQKEITLPIAGRWLYYWETTTPAGVEPGTIEVSRIPF